MDVSASSLPLPQLADLARALAKGLRAFQMYLPNNPMYQRAEQALATAFGPVFAELDEVTLLIREHELVWEDQVVYSHEPRSESFAWDLYKDGMRVVTFQRGCEAGEAARFLRIVSQARLLPADAGDDLLTLLWAEEFHHIRFHFAEVVTDPWVYHPEASALAAASSDGAALREQVREEVAQPRPEGVVDPQGFDSTLYFLDEAEIAEFRRLLAEEYERDHQTAALLTLFDIFELTEEPEVRLEILDTIEGLLPVLLARRDFRAVALVVRELRATLSRAAGGDARVRDREDRLLAQLSAPGAIEQLLELLDAGDSEPVAQDLAEVLRELRVPALRAILAHLPRVQSDRIRELVGAAAHRLAARHAEHLADLLGELEPEALPGAIRLAGRLGHQPVVIPALGALVRHAEADVRRVAVEVLGGIGTPGALAALEPALEDPAREVRAAALAAVTRRRYAGALRRLDRMVHGGVALSLERGERRLLFEAYATVAGPAALEPLRTMLLPRGLFRRRLDPDTRTCAVYAVGRIRSPQARALLEALTGDRDLPVRHAAQTLLREWAS